jgi:hypothetical protein
MTFQRAILCITAAFFAIGFAESEASAQCQLAIEVNALRGGSPTVTVGEFETKKITAKARILKGTAVKGTTLETTLEIKAVDELGVITRLSTFPHFLEIGKGGQGGSIAMPTTRCVGGSIEFIATFSGDDGNGLCEATKSITKTCK